MRKVTKYKAGFGTVIIILIYYKFFHIKEPDWNMLNEVDIVGREAKEVQRHDKWIVVTSIQSPTESLQKLALIPNWRIIVVGDRKTPKNWKLSNVVYLDTDAQKAQKYRIHEYLPYDSYTRKIVGYLYAIEHGAQFIYETDDDNFIETLDLFHTKKAHRGLVVQTHDLTYNPYPHFGQTSMWPRGFPLDYVGMSPSKNYYLCPVHTPAIQQGLVNGDPDVDAIFRMTRKHSLHDSKDPIKFDSSAPVVIVPQGTFSPFNSQNTLYLRKAFWALILPTMFTDRATDIYRAYWAQKLLWLVGSNLAFYPPNGYQKRNRWHTNINDAKDEKNLYTDMGRYIRYLNKWACSKLFFFDCVTQLTEELVIMGFWSKRDLELVNAWVTDLATISYAPPALKESHSTGCDWSDVLNVVHYPWEQNITMQYTKEFAVLPNSNNFKTMQKHASDICGLAHHVYFENAIIKAPKFLNILLVVTIYGNISVIPTLDVIYRIHFAHILYCGSVKMDFDKLNKLKVSYISLKNANPVTCVSEASKMNYNVEGYLHVTENIFLQFESLHVSQRNNQQMWVTGLDLYMFKEINVKMCNQGKLHCVQTDKEKFFMLAEQLRPVQADSKTKGEYIKCVKKIGSDPTLKTAKITTSRELTFYVPKRLSKALQDIVDVYLKDSVFDSYEFIAILMLECVEVTAEYLHSSDMQDLSSTEHYDYIFPFVFRDIAFNQDSEFKQKYCNYIKNH